MNIYKRVTRKIDIGPMQWVLWLGPDAAMARTQMGMSTVCKACNKSLVEGDELCVGLPAKPCGNILLHEKCLDNQARSVMRIIGEEKE